MFDGFVCDRGSWTNPRWNQFGDWWWDVFRSNWDFRFGGVSSKSGIDRLFMIKWKWDKNFNINICLVNCESYLMNLFQCWFWMKSSWPLYFYFWFNTLEIYHFHYRIFVPNYYRSRDPSNFRRHKFYIFGLSYRISVASFVANNPDRDNVQQYKYECYIRQVRNRRDNSAPSLCVYVHKKIAHSALFSRCTLYVECLMMSLSTCQASRMLVDIENIFFVYFEFQSIFF